MRNELFGFFGTGFLAVKGERRDVASLPWAEHKDFPGVFLKNIVLPEDTQSAFTCHLVRVDPGCAIGLHAHPASVELHEVVAGSGTCVTAEGEIPYSPGVMAVLPRNAEHQVNAGKEGLCLLAKFIAV